MKKIFIFTIIITLLLSSCNYLGFLMPADKHTTYRLSATRCSTLFGHGPEKTVQSFKEAEWVQGHYISATVDDDGYFVFVLSDDDIQVWKNFYQPKIDDLLKIIEEQGEQKVVLNAEYTKMEYSINAEGCMSFMLRYIGLMYDCGIINLLNGVDIEAWQVETTVYNIDNQDVIWHGFWPQDKPTIDPKDFV